MSTSIPEIRLLVIPGRAAVDTTERDKVRASNGKSLLWKPVVSKNVNVVTCECGHG